MIVITGAAGFIGSSMASHLNESGHHDLILVDDFTCNESLGDSGDIRCMENVPREYFFEWAAQNRQHIDFLIHLDEEVGNSSQENALEYSQRLWSMAAKHRIPLLYKASSAEEGVSFFVQTDGTVGWGGVENKKEEMKRKFDYWVMKQRVVPPIWAGFCMAEVYGPHECYSGRNASSVLQVLRQICQTGSVTIPYFPSCESAIEEPLTDRIYEKDVATVIAWFMNHLPSSGIYRLVTGYPRPLSAVAKAVFSVLKEEEKLVYVPLSSISENNHKNKYEVPLSNLRAVGYKKNFMSLEKGTRFLVKEYLKKCPL